MTQKPLYYHDSLVALFQGDVREALASVPAGFIHAVITSPPYWALRDYKVDGQIGMEPTIEEYVAHMVEVFRGVRRVLRDDGLLFLNLGDSMSNLQLANIPHRVAQALQADGWYWRQTWHWIKRSPMPESVSGTRWQRCRVKVEGAKSYAGDKYGHKGAEQGWSPATDGTSSAATWAACPGCLRCTYPERPERNGWVLRRGSWRYTDAVEYVFLIAKQPGYTAFQEQVREDTAPESLARYERGSTYDGSKPYGMANPPSGNLSGRNPRNWALLSSEPQSVAHFATYPTALVEPFIRAATSDKGVCATCGAQWIPVVETSPEYQAMLDQTSEQWFQRKENPFPDGKKQDNTFCGVSPSKTVLDYWPSCDHTGAPVPAVVLDPFSGSGTTCLAARTLGRRSIGIDLSADYLDIAVKRLGDERKAQMEML